MALILPEISLLKVLEGLLKWIKYDYEDRLAEEEVEKSYLYRLFGGVEYNGFNYFEQAKELLTRDDLDQRKMGVRVFFDQSRAHLPTVHITLPGETEDLNGLGYNYDGEKFERKFSSRYSLIVTSDNYSEVIIIYYTIKALLTSGFMSLEEFGLRNIKIGGGDLQLNQDIVPQNVFYRGVFIDFFYEDCIPSMEYDPDDMVRGVYLQGRLIETSGDIPPIPPPTSEFRLLHNRLDEESRKLIGQHPGEAISLDPSGFSKNLGEGVDTVQKLATAVDELEASPVVTDPLTPSNDAVVVGDGFQDIASKVAGLQENILADYTLTENAASVTIELDEPVLNHIVLFSGTLCDVDGTPEAGRLYYYLNSLNRGWLRHTSTQITGVEAVNVNKTSINSFWLTLVSHIIQGITSVYLDGSSNQYYPVNYYNISNVNSVVSITVGSRISPLMKAGSNIKIYKL